MPAYTYPPYSKSIYPGANALAVGYPRVYGGPASLASDQPETMETGYKSIPIVVMAQPGLHPSTQRQVVWQIIYGTAPSAATLLLEGSITDVDAEYATVDTSTSTSEETRTTAVTALRFFRIHASSLTGGCSAVIRITCM